VFRSSTRQWKLWWDEAGSAREGEDMVVDVDVPLRKLLRGCALESRRAEWEHQWMDPQAVQKEAKESQRESAGRESWRFGAFMRPDTGRCGRT
jgi:hypothetical protein